MKSIFVLFIFMYGIWICSARVQRGVLKLVGEDEGKSIRSGDGQRRPLRIVRLKRHHPGDEEVGFLLHVNPSFPRELMYLKNYSGNCDRAAEDYCRLKHGGLTFVSRCPAPDTPTPLSETCGPTKPTRSHSDGQTLCRYLGRASVINDPCDECPPPGTTGSTPYVPCISQLPPTMIQRIKYCRPTTAACVQPTPAYQPCLTTQPPLTLPTCPDSGGAAAPAPPAGSTVPPLLRLRRQQPPPAAEVELPKNLPAPKYYVLVKRSPGTWKVNSRGKRFRIYRLKKK